MGKIDGQQIATGTILTSDLDNNSTVNGGAGSGSAVLEYIYNALTTHTGNTSNPHSVTAAQVGAIATTAKGANNGVAELDSNGKIPASQLPALALERMTVVANQTARYALTTADVQNGDVVKQTDTGSVYVVTDDTQLSGSGGYTLLTTPSAAPVDSVFGRIGAIEAEAGDYSTDLIDNASSVPGATLSDALDDHESRIVAIEGIEYDSDLITNTSFISGATVTEALEQLAAMISEATPVYAYLDQTPTGTVNGSNQDFTVKVSGVTVSADVNETEVYLNNLWQEPGVDYTWQTSDTIIRFATAPPNGWRVRVRGKQAA